MKRKKWMALMMAAALTITGTGQTAGVLAAEFTDAGFTDAEEYVSPQAVETVSEQGANAGNTGETAQWEDADIFSSDAEESDAEPDIAEEPEEDQEFLNMEEDIFQVEGPEESDELELPDADESEEELFSSEEPEEAFADGEDEEILSAGAVKADYSGRLISKEEFEHLIQTGGGPDGEWVEKKGTSFADFMKNFANKTGYLLVAADNNEGYEDMVIPEGLTVVIACGAAINIKSITPNGNLYIWENVFTPGTLEIKEGKGSVTFKDSPVDGAIVGNGSNDTLILDGDWVDVNGLKGVENIVISEGFDALGIGGGSSEFYNITNNHKNCKNGYAMAINLEEYNASSVPVFHKKIDLGTTKHPEEGEIEGYLTVRYREDDGQGGMETITLKPGQQAVKFDLSNDSDILDMIHRVLVDTNGSGPFEVDIDGTFYDNHDWDSAFHIRRIRAAGGLTEAQILDHYAIDNVNPDDAFVDIYASRTLGNAVRIINADQKKGKGEDGRGSGYFEVYIPENYNVEGTLTVPDAAKGIVYNFENNRTKSLSSIQVPKGKRLRVVDLATSSGTLAITGEGMTEIVHGKMNQTVTAGNLTLNDCAVKSLTCDNLISEDTTLAVGTSLKFKKANLGGTFVFAKSSAVIDMGEIDNGSNNQGFTAIYMEVNNGKKATVKGSGNIKPGKAKDENGNVVGDAGLGFFYYDYVKAKAAGAPWTKDIFSREFRIYTDSEALDIDNFRIAYDKKAESLVTFSGNASQFVKTSPGRIYFLFDGSFLAVGESPILADGKYMLVDIETEKEVKGYIQTDIKGDVVSISKATVSAIKDQAYTGKEVKPSVTVKLGERERILTAGTDYTVSYKNNIKVGTATAVITGKGNYNGTISKTFEIVNAAPAKGTKTTVGALQYKVTKSATKNGTVSVIAPADKNSTSITIPATVKINGYTFNVTAIASNAFKSCTKLTKVTIGSKVTSIETQAFYGCKNLKTITVNTSGLKTVGKNALKGINAKAVISVSYAKLSAYKKLFSGKGQSSTVKISNPVPAKGKTVQSGALKYTITKSASKNGTVKVAAPVKNTNTSITIPSTVKIEGYTFKVTAIAASAFKNNTKLTKATLGANLTTIGKEAFYGCKSLKTITVKTTSLKSVGANALKGINAKATIKVPSAKLTAYKTLLKGKGQSSSVKITK